MKIDNSEFLIRISSFLKEILAIVNIHTHANFIKYIIGKIKFILLLVQIFKLLIMLRDEKKVENHWLKLIFSEKAHIWYISCNLQLD